jgi:hypothetical protein
VCKTVEPPAQTHCPLCGKPLAALGTMTLHAGEASVFECPDCPMPLRMPRLTPLPFMFVVDADGHVIRPDEDPDVFA